MTATQVAFAFAAAVIAPGFGLCGARACVATELGWRRGFLVAAIAAWAALAISGVVAALCHPRYPFVGPPEHVAMVFVAPCLIVGTAAVLLLMRFAPPRPADGLVRAGDLERDRRGATRLLVLGVALSSLVLIGLYHLLVLPMHVALPWSAREVHEYYRGEALLPDFSYCLKARVPERELAPYAARMGLAPLGGDTRVDWTRPWDLDGHDTSWWDPPPVAAGRTFVWQGGDTVILADWKDGWLYVSGLNH